MNEAVRELEGTWEEIVTHGTELRGHHIKVTVFNGKHSSQAILASSPLERGSYERIMQGLQQFPLEPDNAPDLWEVIAEERAAWRKMAQENSE